MIKRGLKKPLYEQLKDKLKEQIQKNELKPNDQLPSEKELEEHYGVSRITVRQAIALAEKEGLVSKIHGVGTFVATPKVEQELDTINNFQNTVERLGLVASTEIIKRDRISGDFQLAKLLNSNVMDIIYHMQLVGLGDNHPIVYYNSYFSGKIGKEAMEVAEDFKVKQNPFSTLDIYNHIHSVTPSHLEQTFEAMGANAEVADHLKIDQGFPLLKITSMVYENQTPLEYRESYYRGDKYKFFATRTLMN